MYTLIIFDQRWKLIAVILFIQAAVFGSLLWMVPDVHVKPKSVTNEYIFSRTYIKQVLVMIMLMVLQQLPGIGILHGQLSRILSGIGLNTDSLFQSIIFNLLVQFYHLLLLLYQIQLELVTCGLFLHLGCVSASFFTVSLWKLNCLFGCSHLLFSSISCSLD